MIPALPLFVYWQSLRIPITASVLADSVQPWPQVVVVGHTFKTQARKAVAMVPAAPAPPPRMTVQPAELVTASIVTPAYTEIRPARTARSSFQGELTDLTSAAAGRHVVTGCWFPFCAAPRPFICGFG